MNTIKNFWLVLGSFFVMIFSAQTTLAQSYNINKGASEVKVEGTSNIHDWELSAKDFQGNMTVEMADGQLVKINQLNFAVVAESLKSGKSGMDKNVYKALNTDDHQRITYQLESVENIDCTSSTSCKVTTKGYLTIAGTKKLVDVVFDATVNSQGITLKGDKKLNMTNYKVDPPTAMFGTITTGEDVTVKFNAVFSK